MGGSVPGDAKLDGATRFIVTGRSGDYIFREGDAGTEMYVIQEGEIEILKVYGPSNRRLALLEAGDFFGEISLLEELPREESARAVTDYKLLKIDHSTFDRMVQENPEIAVRMLHKLSRRLRERQEADLKALRMAREVLGDSGADQAPLIPAEAERPRVSAPRAVLIHDASKAEFQLSKKSETTIGRIDRVTGFVPDIDFTEVDTHRTASRRHAKISRRDDGFYLREEIGASNGTFVNGKRIKTGTPVKLEDGDEIRFGLVKTFFQCR
ncbi:MAG: cyclic nucleotide-binding domain-containing protein [Acidobacteriota bacterium]